MQTNKAVFIDKDGTLLIDVPYNVNPEFIEFNEYAIEALKLLHEQGYKIIIISNQPGVALGYFTESELTVVGETIATRLQENGIALTGFFYCPHYPSGKNKTYAMSCNCRKPQPGLITIAADEMHIDVMQSWMIGDILHDVEAGNRAGCRTIFLDNGNETEWDINEWRKPDFITGNLLEAAQHIISEATRLKMENEKLAELQ